MALQGHHKEVQCQEPQIRMLTRSAMIYKTDGKWQRITRAVGPREGTLGMVEHGHGAQCHLCSQREDGRQGVHQAPNHLYAIIFLVEWCVWQMGRFMPGKI
eukprot:5741010-Ditylum_brightwellii.AAC.1